MYRYRNSTYGGLCVLDKQPAKWSSWAKQCNCWNHNIKEHRSADLITVTVAGVYLPQRLNWIAGAGNLGKGKWGSSRLQYIGLHPFSSCMVSRESAFTLIHGFNCPYNPDVWVHRMLSYATHGPSNSRPALKTQHDYTGTDVCVHESYRAAKGDRINVPCRRFMKLHSASAYVVYKSLSLGDSYTILWASTLA